VRLSTAWEALSRDEILKRVRRADHDPRREVLLEEIPSELPPALADSTDSPSGCAIALAARENAPGDWSIEVPVGAKGVVVLGECDDPGWRARDAQGRAIETFRADGLFLGFIAPAHGGSIRVRHEPASVARGAIVSCVSLALAVAAAMAWAHRSRAGTGAGGRAAAEPAAFARVGVPGWAVPAALSSAIAIAGFGIVTRLHVAVSEKRDDALLSTAVRAWCAEAEGAYRTRSWDAAATLLERAAQAAPGDASIRYRRGLVERDRGRPEEARREFERAIQLDPSLDAPRTALRDLLESGEEF
jgi:tetratricopeptide (TPR) repeat protein